MHGKYLRPQEGEVGDLILGSYYEWSATKNADDSWSFVTNGGRVMTAREAGNLIAILSNSRRPTERFLIETW